MHALARLLAVGPRALGVLTLGMRAAFQSGGSIPSLPPPAAGNDGWYFDVPEASGHVLTAGFF